MVICLFAAGIHAATAALPHARAARVAVAAVVVAFALARPVQVGYWDSNGTPQIQHPLSHAHADYPVILSPSGVFLAAFYGPWPVTTLPTEANAQAVVVTGERNRTLFLPRSGRAGGIAAEFLHQFRSSDRVWYLGWSEAVVTAMTDAGYTVQSVEETPNARLLLGKR